MDDTGDILVKILFRFYSDILDKHMTETLWASTVDPEKGYYKLDNIPFYVPGIACDDIIRAEYDESEKFLTYRDTVEYSGNSNIQIIILDATADVEAFRNIFKEMGCESEGTGSRYFSMEVPKSIEYIPVKQKLDELESLGFIGYAESCLSAQHGASIR